MKRVLTVTELLEEYGDILLETTVESIKKTKSMPTKTKESLMKQLDHYFESSEYLKGNRSNPPRFILGALRQPVTPYKVTSRGRPKKDFTNERNAMMSLLLGISQDNDNNGSDFYVYYSRKTLLKLVYGFDLIGTQAMNFYASDKSLNYSANTHLLLFMMSGSSAIYGREERYRERDLRMIEKDIDYLTNNKLTRMKEIFHELLLELSYRVKHMAIYTDRKKSEEITIEKFIGWRTDWKKIYNEKMAEGNNSLKAVHMANKEMSRETGIERVYELYGFHSNYSKDIDDYKYNRDKLRDDMHKRLLVGAKKEQDKYTEKIKSLKEGEKLIEPNSLHNRLKREGEYYNYMSNLLTAIRDYDIMVCESEDLIELKKKIKDWREKESVKAKAREKRGAKQNGAKS